MWKAIAVVMLTVSPVLAHDPLAKMEKEPNWTTVRQEEGVSHQMGVDLNSRKKAGSKVEAMVCLVMEGKECATGMWGTFRFDCDAHTYGHVHGPDDMPALHPTGSKDSAAAEIEGLVCAK